MTPEILEHLEAAADLAWRFANASPNATQRHNRRSEALRIERIVTKARVAIRLTTPPPPACHRPA